MKVQSKARASVGWFMACSWARPQERGKPEP